MNYVAAVAAAFALSACDRSLPTGPERVEAPGVSRILSLTDDEAAILADAGIAVRQPAAGEKAATGGVWYGAPRAMLAFSAVLHRDGSVSGEYEYRSADGLTRLHGQVTCLTVSGTSARFSGPVTKPGLLPDQEFTVQDNGEGANDPADVVAGPLPGSSACGPETAAPPGQEVVQGNLQVHQ